MKLTNSKLPIKKKFPLSQTEINGLIVLEAENSRDPHNKELISEMIDKYAKLVEFYDSQQDPIKAYFVEKMQVIISNLHRSKQKE